MLHIIIAPCNGDEYVKYYSLSMLQKMSENNKTILVNPDKRQTPLRKYLIEPLLKTDGLLPDEVYKMDSVYTFNKDKIKITYDFGYLPHRIN